MADDDDNGLVVSLEQYRIERTTRYCGHRGTKVIDDNSRSVKCKRCDAPLDPFDCLLQIASDHERLVQRKETLHKEISILEKKLYELQRNESNTKARLKRLSHKFTGPTGTI